MIELWLVSVNDLKYTYKFSILGLKGLVIINKSLNDRERYNTIILSNLDDYYENDINEQAEIKYKLMKAVENGNYEDYILRMTH